MIASSSVIDRRMLLLSKLDNSYTLPSELAL
nr:MAG TPA: hypothetical protein [Caudoviricetes sp.]